MPSRLRPTALTTSTPVDRTMHTDLIRVWRYWVAVLAICALALVLGIGWYAARAGDELTAPELRQTTDVIGRSISAEIDRALGYQIPVGELAGVEPWFASIVAANPVVVALALTDDTGRLLTGHRVPGPLLEKLAVRREHLSDTVGDWHISTVPVHSGTVARTVGWLHVVGSAPDTDRGTLLLAAATAALINPTQSGCGLVGRERSSG